MASHLEHNTTPHDRPITYTRDRDPLDARVATVLGIDPGTIAADSLALELAPGGAVARWCGVLVLDDDQRAAVAAILAGTRTVRRQTNGGPIAPDTPRVTS